MRKTERLDQILIRLGYATQSEVDVAFARQQEKGGRFGTNLVELGALTEEQLFDALVEQFRVPTIMVDENSVPLELLERMPEGVLQDSFVVPVAWNEKQRVLSLAVANPSDEETIERVRAAFGAQKVRISIAPESVLADLVVRLGVADADHADPVRLVALPELFEPEAREDVSVDIEAEGRRLLMVTSGAARKNFLPPVFKAEGYGLIVAATAEEVADALSKGGIESVLVASDMEGELASWIRAGQVPEPGVEVATFSSVTEALLENPIPYTSVVMSLRASVQAMAEFRCAQHGVSPPYGLMSNDLEAMADRLGLRRVVADGASIGLHLLIPVEELGRTIDPFQSFTASLELAARIRFPWHVDAMLGACQGLYVGRVDLNDVEDASDEMLLAAQILALVWFRHNMMKTEAETNEDAQTEVRTALRELAGRIATLEIIEAYLDTISERGGVDRDAAERQVLLVGADRISRALSPALTRVGCATLAAEDVARAQTVAEEEEPSAIVIDHEVFGAEVERFGRVVKLGGRTLLFALTDSTDPALVLNLLDIGVDDVFGPPHDFDLVAARVSRAIRSRKGQAPTDSAQAGQFSATFEAFSFLDLAQMLSNGMKTVRVDFSRSDDEEAVLYLVNGRPVYACCGDLMGPEAVYRVITWEEQGEFTVSEESDFPEQNIQESTEALLMEGVRLLDESRA